MNARGRANQIPVNTSGAGFRSAFPPRSRSYVLARANQCRAPLGLPRLTGLTGCGIVSLADMTNLRAAGESWRLFSLGPGGRPFPC
jgi:hypothetical protein